MSQKAKVHIDMTVLFATCNTLYFEHGDMFVCSHLSDLIVVYYTS